MTPNLSGSVKVLLFNLVATHKQYAIQCLECRPIQHFIDFIPRKFFEFRDVIGYHDNLRLYQTGMVWPPLSARCTEFNVGNTVNILRVLPRGEPAARNIRAHEQRIEIGNHDSRENVRSRSSKSSPISPSMSSQNGPRIVMQSHEACICKNPMTAEKSCANLRPSQRSPKYSW